MNYKAGLYIRIVRFCELDVYLWLDVLLMIILMDRWTGAIDSN